MTPIPHTGLPQGTLDLLILKTLALWRKLSDVVAQVLESV